MNNLNVEEKNVRNTVRMSNRVSNSMSFKQNTRLSIANNGIRPVAGNLRNSIARQSNPLEVRLQSIRMSKGKLDKITEKDELSDNY